MNSNRNTRRQQREEQKPKIWNTISGVMRVYGREWENGNVSYSTSLGRKHEDGSYDNYYFTVRFKRDEDPGYDGGFEIFVNDGFITFDSYEDRNGNKVEKPAIMVLSYDEREA